MGVSKKVETAIGMGLATTFVLTVASLSAYLTETFVLIPLQAQFLRTFVFIYRDDYPQNEPCALSSAWDLPTTDYDQLRCIRSGVVERKSC